MSWRKFSGENFAMTFFIFRLYSSSGIGKVGFIHHLVGNYTVNAIRYRAKNGSATR